MAGLKGCLFSSVMDMILFLEPNHTSLPTAQAAISATGKAQMTPLSPNSWLPKTMIGIGAEEPEEGLLEQIHRQPDGQGDGHKS
jgi:hypothetical protein